MKYAFTDSSGIVVNVIVGALPEAQQQMLLNDYRKLFGAEQIVAVDAETSVWIGGSYTDGVFQAPPEPEPEPAPEPQPEPLPEPQPEPEI
jgi:hypothetical protein